VAAAARAADPPSAAARPPYHLLPGDVLDISVWKETDLHQEVIVRPDGGLSFPLVGEIDTTGKSVADVRDTLVERLKRYIPTPAVTVALKTINGNRVYVLGRVNHPGEFPMLSAIDVMQAISLAGGTTPFAALNDIVILHRQNGVQQAIHFHYTDVERGHDLSQNILLQSGDTVVVP
jgi:polysaccharide export outer membrane protein